MWLWIRVFLYTDHILNFKLEEKLNMKKDKNLQKIMKW